jgi:uncharacterized protein YecE (DUF72 family)
VARWWWSAGEQADAVIRIGACGWSYDHWQPELYAPGLPMRDRLARYAASFSTAELNSSFYRWPRPAAFRSWRRNPPEGFRLSVKAPPGLTHGRRLYAPESWIGRITAGWHELGDKRAVLLVQLTPTHARDDARLAYFLQQVPGWMRLSAEFRHPSWHCEDVFALLEAHRAAYCVMSGAVPAVHPASHHRLCLPADARPRSSPSVRRLLQRHRPEVVGQPDPGMGHGRQRRVHLLQQRRQWQRGRQRTG